MISVGSRDDRKGLSLRYGVGENMDLETELEEGEACFQNNNIIHHYNNDDNNYNDSDDDDDDDDNDDNDDDEDGDSTIDPDVALSYLDEKLQDVLGHFQKDFEGGVSAENLGAKFGGYGSFLPSYQRSPAFPNKTPPKASTNYSSISLNDLFIEGGRQSSLSNSNASQSTRHGPVSTSGSPPPPLRGPVINGKVKQEMHMSSSSKGGDKFTSNGQQSVSNNFANCSDPKSLKVRIKVGSDNLSTRKRAELYSGLGLDVSPTSSLEASPVDSDDFCHVPHDTPREESPTSILEMMTSFPVLGGLLLSPLPNDLLYLTEKEKWEDSSCGSVHKQSQESTFTVNKSDSKVDRNKKNPKPEDKFTSVEPINGNNVIKKEAGNDNSSCEKGNVLDFRKDPAFKSEPLSVVQKEESLDPVLTHDDFRVKKPYKKDGLVGNENSDEKFISFPTKSDSDVSKGGKLVDTGLVKPPKYEKDGIKFPSSSSGGKKKSKGSQSLENGVHSVEVSKISLKNDSSSKNRNNTFGSKVEDVKNNNGKVSKTYKDFFGELDPDLEDGDDMAFEDKPKEYKSNEKGTLESNMSSKEIINGRKCPKPSSLAYPVAPNPISGPPHIAAATVNGVPVPDAAVPAVVNEDWVCCDKCEKWRLLPPGVNPGRLPEKWLCSMLDWLPGMNRCSISQEETTKALTTQFLGPAPTVHGLQPTVHPGAPQSGLTSVDPVYPDQRRQPFGPQTGAKKKHGTKDLPNEPKQERPSLSSNSAKRNLQPSNKTISLNGANQSPLVNEVDFQDSGQSSSLIAEKHSFKHKEKKKQRENFVDEGNNALQLKIRNKRETSQDYSRDSKKVKTDDNNGTFKDRVSDQEGAVSKTISTSVNDLPSRKDHLKYDDRSKDLKSASKPSSINPKSQNGKRKSNEFDGDQIEETSETGQRKGKRVKVPEFREEEKGKLLDSSRRDLAVHASLAATSSSSKVSGSHKTKTNNQETKGSPVESVSSSPLRILNPDKLSSSKRNIDGLDNYQSNTFRKEVDLVEPLEKADIVPSLEFETQGVKPSFQVHNVEKRNDDQSHSRSRKSGKGSSSRSKEKNRSFKSDNDKINLKISERTIENPDVQEKSKDGRNRSQEKPSVNPVKYEKGAALKKESSGKPLSIPDVKQNISKQDMSGRGKPHSLPLQLPPSGKGQNGQNDTSRPPQPFTASQKESKGNSLLTDGVEGGDALKSGKQKKKAENQNGNHLTPNRHKGTPSPLRRESSSQAASAIKEAKALKHMADRLKNSGSNHESNSLYFQAALKFLYGSCLLESSYTENGKHSDMLLSLDMYSSTAKLCEYVAHEYEKSKETAAAALAYKLAEVAYLKVVYSSHANASKDRQELQTTLTGPTGESPSSSASDIDNLNNPTAVDKAPVPKGVNDPQVGGNHVISATNKPNFLRILNFAQNVNFAMEASRRSQMAFAASGSQPEHAHHKEVIKPALDFNFQDIEGLLHLVRVAMEVISR